MPEFIAPQDGAEKQDCERRAAKRWLAAHGGRLKDPRPADLGDDLFACQPVAEDIQAAGGDVLLAAMNLLAFAIHTVCDCLEQHWTNARTAKRVPPASPNTSGPLRPTWSSQTGPPSCKP